MKKLINLIAFVMLVSTNVFTPFSYAQVDTTEVIPENGVETVTEDTWESGKILDNNEETPEINEKTSETNPEEKGELEQGKQEEETPENVLSDAQDDLDAPTKDENKIEDTEKVEIDEAAQPVEENAKIEKQEENLEDNNEITEQENVEIESQELQKIQEISTMDTATNSKDIVLEATSTASNQTLKINKYFANAYTVDRWDGSLTQDLTGDTVHTYSVASGYTITLSTTADRWTFKNVYKPLVPTNWTTVTDVKIVSMPSLADWFGNNATNPGNYFFYNFNSNWKLTSLPEWSFDTSKITTVGSDFFFSFNNKWKLTSLPEWSFDTSKITSVGDYFFDYFNAYWQLINLPTWSFNISKITKAWHEFFCWFNSYWALISLPKWSFDTSNITTVQSDFFSSFNYNWALTSLPTWSFNTSKITNGKNTRFFSFFNSYWALTGLPEWSFNISKITTAGVEFFSNFNANWQLTSLPEWSFNFSGITTVGDYFFYCFNRNWQLTSLPEWSFNTTNITKVGGYFFYGFNRNWQLTSLPEWSFDMSNINTAWSYFFQFFNRFWKIMELPNSFNLALVWVSSTKGYQYAFNSPNYTLNKKVSDLVSGFAIPSLDMYTFSDNQPWRCGVHPNWLSTSYDACKIIYDANGWTGTITRWYNSEATSLVVWVWIKLPSMEWYALSGWYDASWNKVETIIFPDMDGQTLYAQWEECGNGYVVNSTWTSCVLKEYTITYDLWWWYLEDLSWNKYEWNQAITYTYSSTGNKYVANLVWENVKKQDSVFLGWYTASDWWEKVNDITSINIAGETLYAHWNDCESGYTLNNLRTSCVLKEYTITYNLWWWYLEDGSWNKHEWNQAITYTYSSTGNKYVADLVWENVNRENSKFLGWYTSEWEAFDFWTIPPENDTAYAKFGCDFWYAENDEKTACEKIRVEFNANWWKFSDGETIFQKEISVVQVPNFEIKTLHSPNLTDQWKYKQWSTTWANPSGCTYPSWGNWSGNTEIYVVSTWYIQIERADELQVSIKYGWSSYCDPGPIWIWIWEHTNYDPRNPNHSGSAVRYLSSLPVYNSFWESEFSVEWDSISIVQAAWCPNYGRFVTVSGTWKTEVIEYSVDDFENIPEPTREWHSFKWWYLSDWTEFDSWNVSTWEVTYVYAKWECADGYENKWWECIKKSSWSSGWWGVGWRGWWSSKKTDEDIHWSAEDSQKNTQDDKNTENVIQSETKWSEESSNIPMDSSADKLASEWQEILSSSDSSFTKEQKDAYTFAKENWITTKDTIQETQMNGKLTRIAMAKMLSQYAINVLWKEPDLSKWTVKFNDVSNKMDENYDNAVTLSYQLWIMWQNMQNNNFRPNDEVTRAEFVSAFSRMLYNTSDGEYRSTSKYYIHHMEKLEAEWIVTNTDPKMKERRWYVMIMLMRSAK